MACPQDENVIRQSVYFIIYMPRECNHTRIHIHALNKEEEMITSSA